MKHLLTALIAVLIVFSCAVSSPLWIDYNKNDIYIESCRDTIGFNRLDSAFKSNHIKPTPKEWAIMKLYNTKDDNMNQWKYVCKDTIYTITGMDSLYIFTKQQKINNNH